MRERERESEREKEKERRERKRERREQREREREREGGKSGVCSFYLCQRGSENDHLENWAHTFQKLIYTRSLRHVHLMHLIVDLHRNDKICVADRL
jgi:hypothetical protein